MRQTITLIACALLAACILCTAGCAARPAPLAPPDPQSVYRVRASLLNVHKCPNMNCDVIEDLTTGQEVAAISPNMGGWVMVRVLSSGHEGYVEARFLAR